MSTIYKDSYDAIWRAMDDLKEIFNVESNTIALKMLNDPVKREEVDAGKLDNIVDRIILYGEEARKHQEILINESKK